MFGPSASVHRHARTDVSVAAEPVDCRGERRRIPYRHEQTRDLGIDDLPATPHVGRDHREPAGRGLHRRTGKALTM